MKMKKIMLPIMLAMLMSITGLSGCIGPTTEFDTVKIVATITRNGGDFTLTPTGEGGYSLNVITGTLSIEALGLDMNQQDIKAQYKTAEADRKQYYRNLHGGGISGWFKGWWARASGGVQMNTIEDLAIADGGGIFGEVTAQLNFIDTFNTNGVVQHNGFEMVSSNDLTFPDFGVTVFSSKIPASCFPNNKVEPGYFVLNGENDEDFNGVRIYRVGQSDVTENGRSTGFVMYAGNDYYIIAITNEPAYASDDPDIIRASVTLVKPEVTGQDFENLMSSSTDYLTVYSDGMKRQLLSMTTDAYANVDNLLSSSIDSAISKIPGSRIVKSFDSIAGMLDADEQSHVDSIVEDNFMKLLQDDIVPKKDIYVTAYNTFENQVDGLHYLGWFSTVVDIDDGINAEEWKLIKRAYFGYTEWFIWRSAIFSSAQRDFIESAMDTDEANYYSDNNFETFYNTWSNSQNKAKFDGPLFALQLVDDSYLGIFDGKTIEAFKNLLDLEWYEDLPGTNLSDYEDWADQLKKDIVVELTELIPDWMSNQMDGIESDLQNMTDEILALQNSLLVLEEQMSNLISYLYRAIPDVPRVSIFPYQVPSPVYTKIMNATGDFIQADPTSTFSAAVTYSMGDPTNWSLTTGYPRAIIKTQSRGTLTIPLQQDTGTDTWLLRQDMISQNDLVIGDTVKTRFEVQVENGTGAQTLSATSLNYYTIIQKSWLADFLNDIGMDIDDLSDYLDGVESWLGYDDDVFSSGNSSTLESFYATLTVVNEKGEKLYILNPRKNFKLSTNDAEYLVWEVRIFENEPYIIDIVVGNNTVDNVASYRTKINAGEASWYNPFDWGTKIQELS